HLVIVAGIITFAGGVKLVVHNSGQAPMPSPGRLAMCGGVALYLLGLAAFRARMFAEISRPLLVVSGALLALYALGGSIPAWTVGAGIAVLVGAVGAVESLRGAARARPTSDPGAGGR